MSCMGYKSKKGFTKVQACALHLGLSFAFTFNWDVNLALLSLQK